jgi:hypothetical protein
MAEPEMNSQGAAVEKQIKQPRTRPSNLPRMVRKASHILRELEEEAVRKEEETAADHEEVNRLANKAMGGSFSAILKNSPLLTDENRAFLKQLGYI